MKWTLRFSAIVSLGILACARPAICAPPKATAIIDWKAKPDVMVVPAPPATTAPTTAPSTNPLGLKVNLSISPNFPNDRELVVCNRPSKFAVSIAPFWGGYELWDLRIGDKIKGSNAKIDLQELTLSPDGQYLAGLQRRGAAQTVEIWNLRTGQIASHLADIGGQHQFEIAGFADPNRIVLFCRDTADERWQSFDVATGKLALKWSDDASNVSSRAFSATGKYLARIAESGLRVYDTTTGQPVGQVDFTEQANPGFGWHGESAIAFSPNGQLLGAVVIENQKTRLIQVSMNTGKTVSDSILEVEDFKVFSHPFLSYSQDGSRLLVNNRVVVDAATHAVIYSIPARQDPLFGEFADVDHVIQIFKVNRQFFFNSNAIPKDLAAKTIAVVKNGGKSEDALLQPLTPADISVAPAISYTSILPTPWVVKPVAASVAGKPVSLFAQHPPAEGMPIQPRESQHEVSAMLFTGREAHSVFIEHIERNTNPEGGALQQTFAWLEKDDLIAGTGSSVMVVPKILQTLDCSPSGKTLVFRGGSALDRIDIYRAETGAFKPVIAFRPYANLPAATPDAPQHMRANRRVRISLPVLTQNGTNPSQVATAAMVDDAHVLTLNMTGKLALWDLQTAKALWTADVGNVTPLLTLSPDRRLAVLGNMAIIDTMSGRPLNTVGGEDALPVTAMFSPNGMQLAALYRVSGAGLLRIFDLTTGALAASAAVPQGDTLNTIAFASPGYVLVDHASLVNLEKGAVVWKYTLRSTDRLRELRLGSASPYETPLFPVSAEQPRPTHTIVCVTMPNEDAKKVAATIDPNSVYLWAPGMDVKLDLTVDGDDKLREETAKSYADALGAVGIKVVDTSPNVLHARFFTMSGTPIIYKDATEQAQIVPQIGGHDIQLTIDGKEIWKAVYDKPPQQSGGPMMIWVSRKKGEALQTAIDREYPQGKPLPFTICPPTYVFKDRQIGTSEIGPNGVVIAPTLPGVRPRVGK